MGHPVKDVPKWLDMVRKEATFLSLKERWLKKRFQLDTIPINDEILNSLMNDYLKLWPNVERIEMDWIGTTSISQLPKSTNFKQRWNTPCLKFLKLEKRTSISTNSANPITPPGFVENPFSSWSYSYSSSSSTESQYCCRTFRF